jgi:hypothetical protein
LWQYHEGTWSKTDLWTPSFGGKVDRLRDLEVADLNANGRLELIVGTHDQGVVAVLRWHKGRWQALPIFQKKDTYIHEVEVGDIDGDGTKEIVATPSKPNRYGTSQAGEIRVFHYKGKGKYTDSLVDSFENRHVKEVTLSDIDGDGRDELFVSVEAMLQPGESPDRPLIVEPLEVRKYWFEGGTWQHEVLARFPQAKQARSLVVADFDGDDQSEIALTIMKQGLWHLVPGPEGWKANVVDPDARGFEQALAAVDLNGDGQLEIVASDDRKFVVSSYQWKDGSFHKKLAHKLPFRTLVWNITQCNLIGPRT